MKRPVAMVVVFGLVDSSQNDPIDQTKPKPCLPSIISRRRACGPCFVARRHIEEAREGRTTQQGRPLPRICARGFARRNEGTDGRALGGAAPLVCLGPLDCCNGAHAGIWGTTKGFGDRGSWGRWNWVAGCALPPTPARSARSRPRPPTSLSSPLPRSSLLCCLSLSRVSKYRSIRCEAASVAFIRIEWMARGRP